MITHRVINIVDAPVNGIAHQANCFHIMGGGVARAIADRYPEAYAADKKTVRGGKSKLGNFSFVKTSDDKIVFNVYSQYNLSAGFGNRATQYDMVDKGLRLVEDYIAASMALVSDKPFVLGIPFKYGCVLGGGTWTVVDAIIHDIFDLSPVDVMICEWPPASSVDKPWNQPPTLVAHHEFKREFENEFFDDHLPKALFIDKPKNAI
jgi:hypothetical protein